MLRNRALGRVRLLFLNEQPCTIASCTFLGISDRQRPLINFVGGGFHPCSAIILLRLFRTKPSKPAYVASHVTAFSFHPAKSRRFLEKWQKGFAKGI